MNLRAIAIAIFTFFLLLLITAVLADKFIMPTMVRIRDTVEVPDVRGLKMEEVIEKLKESKLVFEFAGEITTDKYPPDIAIAQEPLPGMIVKEGRRVKVTFSRSATSLKFRRPPVESETTSLPIDTEYLFHNLDSSRSRIQ